MTDCRLTHAVKWLSHDKRRGIKDEVKVINERDALRWRRLIANIKRNQKLSSSFAVSWTWSRNVNIDSTRNLFTSCRQTHNQWAAKNKLFIKSHESAEFGHGLFSLSHQFRGNSVDHCWKCSSYLFISFDFKHFYSLDELFTKQKKFSVKVIWRTCSMFKTRKCSFFHLEILIFWTFSLFYSVECLHKSNKKRRYGGAFLDCLIF